MQSPIDLIPDVRTPNGNYHTYMHGWRAPLITRLIPNKLDALEQRRSTKKRKMIASILDIIEESNRQHPCILSFIRAIFQQSLSTLIPLTNVLEK